MKDPPFVSKVRAAKAYYDFTGHKPDKISRARLDDKPVAGYRMGEVVGIAYEAVRDGKRDQYFHRFSKKVRPDLVSRSDGKQLYITGGKYKVTDRGIEDMPSLFVFNPSARRRKTTRKAKGRTRKGTFMANPRRRRRRRVVSRRRVSYAVNPRRRRRHRRARRTAVTVFRRNPIRRRRRHHARRVSVRRFRRNPMTGRGGIKISSLIMPAAFVGLGAVGAEIVLGYLPVPTAWKTGNIKYATKAAVAVGLGMLVAKFFNRRLGEALAMGGVAISVHDAARNFLAASAPNIAMGGYNWNKYNYPVPLGQNFRQLGYYSPGTTVGRGMGQYVRSGMHGAVQRRVGGEQPFRV